MNKPHGYVWTSLKDGMETRFTNMYPNEFYKPFDIVPVYTHPAKTLTDEEIEEVWIQALQDEPKVNAGKFPSLSNQPFVFFARAILRKVQNE